MDLALIDGKRFDIRFYVLVVRGKAYLHRGGYIKTGGKFNASSVSAPILDRQYLQCRPVWHKHGLAMRWVEAANALCSFW
jgi:hypothetical protein